MAKRKVSETTKTLAERIKEAVDAGNFQLVAELTEDAQRESKTVGRKVSRVQPEPGDEEPTRRTRSASCIAPARTEKSAGQVIVGPDGRERRVSARVPWSPPKGPNKFLKDKAKDSEREPKPLNYPEPVERRDPVEEEEFICHECKRVFWMYATAGPAIHDSESAMLYTCTKCLKRNNGF